MAQLSFFSAELDEPSVDDLAGLLAAHGQVVSAGGASRISVVVDAPWRVEALVRLVEACGLVAERGTSDEGRPLFRTASTAALHGLVRAWTRGAVKTVPPGWTPQARALRAWVLAAGRGEEAGFVLGLDPHAVDTHLPLTAALSRAGLAGTLLGPRGGGPAVRVGGRRRLLRLAQSIGEPPAGAPAAGVWPDPDGARPT